MCRRRLVLLVVLGLLVLAGLVVVRSENSEQKWALELLGGCYLEYLKPPERVLALDCPRTYYRYWPWPPGLPSG